VSQHAVVIFIGISLLWCELGNAQTESSDTPKSAPESSATDSSQSGNKPELIPINPQKTAFIDRVDKKVILETTVVFRNGLLEMLVCLKQTKEHESILAFDGKARDIHAALLAVGAQAGKPVSWDPEFRPPTGQKIEISLMWQDDTQKWHRSNAEKWLRSATRKYFITHLKQLPAGVIFPDESDLRYDEKHQELLWFGVMDAEEKKQALALSSEKTFQTAVGKLFQISQIKPMTADWVFAGSAFYVDEGTGESHYLAEDGNLICVANFSSATIDVREKSSADAAGLAYEAWEERIPPLGTKVRVELKPVPLKRPKK